MSINSIGKNFSQKLLHNKNYALSNKWLQETANSIKGNKKFKYETQRNYEGKLSLKIFDYDRKPLGTVKCNGEDQYKFISADEKFSFTRTGNKYSLNVQSEPAIPDNSNLFQRQIKRMHARIMYLLNDAHKEGVLKEMGPTAFSPKCSWLK